MARHVVIELDDSSALHGDLTIPDSPRGIVLFAHGSGSSRLSPRNRSVARALEGHALGTMLTDLLTAREEAIDSLTRQLRFDIDLLARRLLTVTQWLGEDPAASELPLAYFGASTGAAAALTAAADLGDRVAAIVSRGGRPDLAGAALPAVTAPTLLIVGSHDSVVLELNRAALARLGGEHRLEVVEGATHLFEERGALDEVARLAGEWFAAHLPERRM